MTVTLERAREKIIQLALCLLVGTLSGGILLLDLSLKWEIVFFGVIGIIVLILVTKRPERVLLGILAFIVPFYFEKAIITQPGSTTYATNVSVYLSDILALALLLIFLGKLARKQVKINSFANVMVPALAWLIVSFISLFAAKDGELVLFQLINIGKMILFCWVVASSVEHDGDLTFVITGLMLGIAFQSLVAIYQGVTGHPLGLGFLTEATVIMTQQLGVGLVNRVQGTMGYPNTLAMYLSTGVPFALALLFSEKRFFVKVLVGITLCLISWALILSLSRAAWGNFLVTICLVLVLAIRRKRIRLIAAIVIGGTIAILLLGVALFGTDLIQSRLTSNDQGSAASRITLDEGALAVIRDNPVIGIGLNNYVLVSPRYDQADAAAWNDYTPIVHNAYLLIAAETGLLGLGAFVVFMVILLIQVWKIVNQALGDTVWVAGVGILGALIALIIHSMVDYALLGSSLLFTQFWLLIGLSAALMQRIDRERQDIRRDSNSSNTMTRG